MTQWNHEKNSTFEDWIQYSYSNIEDNTSWNKVDTENFIITIIKPDGNLKNRTK